MAKEEILDEIEKRCKELAVSNEELAQRLKENQAAVSRFNSEMADLKAGSATISPDMKAGLERLKEDLEEKKQVISALMAELKPLEVDVRRREDLVDTLNVKIKDQDSKIVSLSKDLSEQGRLLGEIKQSNTALKEKVVEKEGTIQILKEKLARKNAAFRELEDANSRMHAEIESYKKEVFGLTNRFGAVENRIQEVDEQNQALMGELVAGRERLQELESEISGKEASLDSLEMEHAAELEALRREEESKRVRIMESNTKKLSVLKAQIDSLKTQMQKQQEALNAREQKEREILSLFGNKMQELLSQRTDFALKLRSLPEEKKPVEARPKAFEEPETKGAGGVLDGYEISEAVGAAEVAAAPVGGSRVDEILPIIELARDYGDNEAQIRQSLISSGYPAKDIDEAFSKVPLVQKN